MKLFLTFACLLFSSQLLAQDTLKKLQAIRVSIPPKVDGELNEDVWKNVPAATDFIQDEPDYGLPSSQRTEVKICYDDNAIYIGAFLYDPYPDSILHEYGNKDDFGLNADYFTISIDTYYKLVDAYTFGVSASGIQIDSRIVDPTYNAVWSSVTQINSNGWCAEFKIPLSAIRFPEIEEQKWRINLQRTIRRRREISRWTFIPRDMPNPIHFYGYLEGISSIKSPFRLSLTPYLAGYAENSPEYNIDGTYKYAYSTSYNIGADLKYGIDDRFTIDMTLLPDFGQVQSDNKVKNLSYNEYIYSENRPFFNEGTELFNKNNLFYSRRIGRTPTLYYSLPYLINEREVIEENPAQAKLINATKLSGRTNNGLGIGLLNAATASTYAIVSDSMGNKREILTEPFTNYNVIVFDQQLKNSSSVYVINTNVIRSQTWDDANITGAGFGLYDKKGMIFFTGDVALSQKYERIDTLQATYNNQLGVKYYVGADKVNGNYRFGVKHEVFSHTFDQLDLGFFSVNNFRNYYTYLKYVQFAPGKFFRSSEVGASGNYSENFITCKRTGVSIDFNSNALLKNYLALFGGGNISPYKNHDYYEPRTDGRTYITRRYYYLFAGIGMDNRKKFAANISAHFAHYIGEDVGGAYYSLNSSIRMRFNDKFSLFYIGSVSTDEYNEGFASFDQIGNIIIGGRQIHTYENQLKVKYIIRNNMSLLFSARHYWSLGEYLRYFVLLEDGHLADATFYEGNNNFSYNAFNIDLVYSWQFAPGSHLLISYKNAIESDKNITVVPRFNDNFSATLQSPQTNSISIKMLYYLDYQSITQLKKK